VSVGVFPAFPISVNPRADSDLNRAIIVTTSSKKERLENYLAVGDIELSDDEVKEIDKAGAKGEANKVRKENLMVVAKWTAVFGLVAFAGLRALS
jgi:hypothetical protein